MNKQFPHAMLREIYDQPEALRATLAAFAEGDHLREEAFTGAARALQGESLLIAASGSSRHAGLVGKVLFEQLAGLRVEVDYASEYITRSGQKPAAMLVLSQSGETADTLEALRLANDWGAATIAITNHAGSAMSRLAGCSLTTRAGVERAVPATKSFTTQLLVLELLALYAAQVRGTLSVTEIAAGLVALQQLPGDLERNLPLWDEQIATSATKLDHAENVLFLGRGIHFPVAAEGALKLKESAYIAAEAYPAGELKHGPAALLDKHAVLVALAAVDRDDEDSVLRFNKTKVLLDEMRALGLQTIEIGPEIPQTKRAAFAFAGSSPIAAAGVSRGASQGHRCGPAPQSEQGGSGRVTLPRIQS